MDRASHTIRPDTTITASSAWEPHHRYFPRRVLSSKSRSCPGSSNKIETSAEESTTIGYSGYPFGPIPRISSRSCLVMAFPLDSGRMCGHTSRCRYSMVLRYFSSRLGPTFRSGLPFLQRPSNRLRLRLPSQLSHFCRQPLDLGILDVQSHITPRTPLFYHYTHDNPKPSKIRIP